MQLLSYGYKLPDSGDPAVKSDGNGWFSQVEYDIIRFNSHSHNGTDSALLSVGNFTGYTVVAPAASWVASGVAVPYKQSLTAPVQVTDINNFILSFFVSTGGTKFGQRLFLRFDRTGTGNTFDLYCNDNSIDVTCLMR